jgi:uncharacterized protein YggE
VKKRILVLLSVVALMVVMLAISVAPAFAKSVSVCVVCVNQETQGRTFVVSGQGKQVAKDQSFTECRKL